MYVVRLGSIAMPLAKQCPFQQLTDNAPKDDVKKITRLPIQIKSTIVFGIDKPTEYCILGTYLHIGTHYDWTLVITGMW
jgi:hypothetical protein